MHHALHDCACAHAYPWPSRWLGGVGPRPPFTCGLTGSLDPPSSRGLAGRGFGLRLRGLFLPPGNGRQPIGDAGRRCGGFADRKGLNMLHDVEMARPRVPVALGVSRERRHDGRRSSLRCRACRASLCRRGRGRSARPVAGGLRRLANRRRGPREDRCGTVLSLEALGEPLRRVAHARGRTRGSPCRLSRVDAVDAPGRRANLSGAARRGPGDPARASAGRRLWPAQARGRRASRRSRRSSLRHSQRDQSPCDGEGRLGVRRNAQGIDQGTAAEGGRGSAAARPGGAAGQRGDRLEGARRCGRDRDPARRGAGGRTPARHHEGHGVSGLALRCSAARLPRRRSGAGWPHVRARALSRATQPGPLGGGDRGDPRRPGGPPHGDAAAPRRRGRGTGRGSTRLLFARRGSAGCSPAEAPALARRRSADRYARERAHRPASEAPVVVGAFARGCRDRLPAATSSAETPVAHERTRAV